MFKVIHCPDMTEKLLTGTLSLNTTNQPIIDLGPDSTFSSFFSLETTRLIEAKFHMNPLWDGGMKVCSNGPGHMTKMAAMPIYGKSIKKSSSLEPKGW